MSRVIGPETEIVELAAIVSQALEGNHQVIEATAEAEAEWVDTIVQMARMNEQFLADCTPGYYNNEGKPSERSRQNSSYGGGPVQFFRMLEDWREEGTMQGLEIS